MYDRSLYLNSIEMDVTEYPLFFFFTNVQSLPGASQGVFVAVLYKKKNKHCHQIITSESS